MARDGFPIVLSAASGTGKTTLAHLLRQRDECLALSISHTTRPPRGDEKNGIDYHFVDEETFQHMVDDAAFLEWACVHGHRYGSGAEATEALMQRSRDVVFDIDVQGANQIKRRLPRALLIFILPPSLDVLRGRLQRRGTDSRDEVDRRMAVARREIETGLDTFDFVIINENLDDALVDVAALIRGRRLGDVDRHAIRARLLGPSTILERP